MPFNHLACSTAAGRCQHAQPAYASTRFGTHPLPGCVAVDTDSTMQAITLDSLGQHEEAHTLYQQLRRHRTRDVARTARAMEYGFDAGAVHDRAALASALLQRWNPTSAVLSAAWQPQIASKRVPSDCSVHYVEQLIAHVHAGTFLKADTISYAATQEDYEPFFAAFASKWQWDSGYVATEEEKAAAARANAIAASAAALLCISPLAAVYVLAQRAPY